MLPCGHNLQFLFFFSDALVQFPDQEQLIRDLPVATLLVLQEMAAKPSVGQQGEIFSSFLNFLLESEELPGWLDFTGAVGNHFISAIVKNKFSMPSTLYKQSLSVVDEVLTSFEDRHLFIKHLTKVGFEDTSIFDSFICEFVFVLSDQLLVLLFQRLRNKLIKVAVLRPLSEKQRQTVHFVAGSIMNKFMGVALRSTKSISWQQIKFCIQTVFLEGEGVAAASMSDRRWTELVDRGGLKICGGEATDFFISLAMLLYSLEERDGSLYLETALSSVFESDVHLKWDSLIKNKLSEIDSVNFLIGVTKTLGQTIGRGIRTKYVNMDPKPVASINMRHGVLTTNSVAK